MTYWSIKIENSFFLGLENKITKSLRWNALYILKQSLKKNVFLNRFDFQATHLSHLLTFLFYALNFFFTTTQDVRKMKANHDYFHIKTEKFLNRNFSHLVKWHTYIFSKRQRSSKSNKCCQLESNNISRDFWCLMVCWSTYWCPFFGLILNRITSLNINYVYLSKISKHYK